MIQKKNLSLAAFILMAGILILNAMGERNYWGDSSEIRHALVARSLADGRGLASTFEEEYAAGTYPLVPLAISIPFLLADDADEVLSRIPSAISAFAALFVTYSIGALLFGRIPAIFAFAVFATSALFSFYAKDASPQMAGALFLLSSLYCLARLAQDQERGLWARLYWVSLALLFYTEGPAPVVIALAGAWSVARGEVFGPGVTGRLFGKFNLAMFAGIIAPWLIFAMAANGMSLAPRSSGAMTGIKDFILQAFLFIPWIFAAPSALLYCAAEKDKPTRLLLSFFTGAVVAAFALSLFGHTHLLGLHGIVALFIGVYIHSCRKGTDDDAAENSSHTEKDIWTPAYISNLIIIFPLFIFTLVIALASFYFFYSYSEKYASFGAGILEAPLSMAASIPIPSFATASVLLAAIYISFKSSERFADSGETLGMWAAAVLSSFACLLYFHSSLAPSLNKSFSHRTFYSQISNFIGKGGPIFHFEKENLQGMFYLGSGSFASVVNSNNVPALLEVMGKRQAPTFILTDEAGKESLKNIVAISRYKPIIYMDSYFVPLTRALGKNRLYLFRYSPLNVNGDIQIIKNLLNKSK